MENSPRLEFLERPPLLFVVEKAMNRRGLRGRWRLTAFLNRHQCFKNKIVRFSLKDNYSVFVPIYRRERWDNQDLIDYEKDLVAALVDEARQCNGPITFADCGADIGLISVKVAAESGRISRIVALEPSDESFPVLKKTLVSLPIKTQAIQIGVSDFTGRGELRSPPYDASHHARYLVQVQDGGFSVTTIDALSLETPNLILKIDVEGGELGVIRGAARSLAAPAKAIVSVEAHPQVFDRTGIDPIRILQELAAIRPFRFLVAETGKTDLDLSRPFFAQQPKDGTIYNIICSSRQHPSGAISRSVFAARTP